MLSSKFLAINTNKYKAKYKFEQISDLIMRWDLLRSKIYNNPATDKLIRIRRTSDNAELDIAVDKWGDLDEFTIRNFAPAGTIYIVTDYDTTVNGYNPTQVTTARQPILNTDTNFNGKKYYIQHDRGNNYYLQTANSISKPSITMMAWIKPNTYPANGTSAEFFGGHVNSLGGAWIMLSTTGANTTFRMFVYADVATFPIAMSVKTFGATDLNVWTHVAATYNKTTKKIYLYINGVLNKDYDVVGATTQDAVLGTFNVGNGYNAERAYGGGLSDVRYYGRDLTAAEIYQIYLER